MIRLPSPSPSRRRPLSFSPGTAANKAPSAAATAPGGVRDPHAAAFIIDPRNPKKRLWDGYILVLVLYTVTLELFNTTMGDGHMMMMGEQSHSTTVDWIVDASYMIDIVLSFVTGYDEHDRGFRYVMDPKKCAERYLKTWFVVDAVSTFPYPLFEQTRGSVISLLRILRTTRLIRAMRTGGNAREIFDAIVASTGIKAAYLDILRLVVGIGLAIHFLACLFHLLGLLEMNGKIGSTENQYGEDKAATWLEQYNIADTFTTLDAKAGVTQHEHPRPYVHHNIPRHCRL